MRNLWDETIKVLEDNGLTWQNVNYVILSGYCCITKKNFEEIARNTNYDSGYGAQEISYSLKLVGYTWWMERREYDGSEWWEFCTMPTIPKEIIKIKSLRNWEEEE